MEVCYVNETWSGTALPYWTVDYEEMYMEMMMMADGGNTSSSGAVDSVTVEASKAGEETKDIDVDQMEDEEVEYAADSSAPASTHLLSAIAGSVVTLGSWFI